MKDLRTSLLEDVELATLERDIALLYSKIGWSPESLSPIRELLLLRKWRLDEHALDHQEELLPDIIAFNEASLAALREVYDRCHRIWETMVRGNRDFGKEEKLDVIGSCELSKEYPPLHPIQGTNEEERKRRQDLWSALIDPDINFYIYGGISQWIIFQEGDSEPFSYYSGLDDKMNNWNEGLDPELTKDLHLGFPFHNLYDSAFLALTDFIYVRDFIKVCRTSN